MLSPTIVSADRRLGSAPISPSPSSHVWSSQRSDAGSARVPRRSRLETELKAAAAVPRASAGRALARDLFVAYVAAWAVGILYGGLIRVSSTWDEGAAWERKMLRWLHQWTLPSWLDAVVLQVPLTGTNLTILPLTLAV